MFKRPPTPFSLILVFPGGRFPLWLLFCLAPALLTAQEIPRVITFSDEKTNNNQIWSLAQSSDHFMYFGTSAGLLQYDGVRWTSLYPLDRSIVRSVAVDEQGRLFTGAFNEFGYWEKDGAGRWQYGSLMSRTTGKLPAKEEIWNIVVQDSVVYFQSFSTILKYDYEEVEVLTPPGNIMFLQPVQDRLLVQVIDGGIYELQPDGRFELLPGTSFFQDKTVAFLLPHGKGAFLVGTAQHGIFRWQEEQVGVWAAGAQEAFATFQLNKGIRLSNGQYAVGTILNGVYLLDTSGRVLYHLNRENGLQNNTVLSLLESRGGNLWIGLDRGVNLVALRSPLTFFEDRSGALGTVYTAVSYEGHLYLGTNHGVFYRPDRLGAPAAAPAPPFRLIEGTQGQVWELQVYDGALWCGHNDGTFIIEELRARRISAVTGGWVSLRPPGRPDLILQGTYAGLVVFAKDPAGGWRFSHRLEGFLDPIRDMVIDSSGVIWVANPIEGVYRLQPDAGFRRVRMLQKVTAAEGLTTGNRVDLLFSEGKVILDAGDERYYYRAATRSVEPLRAIGGQELPGGNYHLAAGGPEEWFLAYTDQVLWRTEGRSLRFTMTMVPGSESVVLLDPDRYLFCLDDGYAFLRREALSAFSEMTFPPPVFTGVVVRGRQVAIPGEGDEPAVFSYADNHLVLRFAQAAFVRPPHFQYWLEGLEEGWSDWTRVPFREYSNLPAGSYVFHLRSALAEEEASFAFTISPHWTNTGWAYAAYLLGLLLVGRGFFGLHRRRLEKERLRLAAETERRLEEQRIKAANEQLQSEVRTKSKELANSTINLARKNEILQEIKKELKKMKKAGGAQPPAREYQHLMHLIDVHLTSEEDWKLFETNFNEVHEAFFKKLKTDFPALTPADLKLAAYLKMNLSSKEIAPLFNISLRGVENKRYRLRKKMDLDEDVSLNDVMMKY